ncbi:MAG: helix-turn-helix domain-containing protein, partial [Kiloniellales bacterium]|nr:helix-turn-helix domain-containing protein [Kiloniellales bacterium]
PSISPAAIDLLTKHHWRGNVRELENTMHRAVLLSQDDVISPDSIMLSGTGLRPEESGSDPTAPSGASSTAPHNEMPGANGLVGRTVADVERDLILDTLNHCLGNRTHAANILGISIRTLRNKLKLYSQDGMAIPMPGEGERPVY